MSLVFPSGLNKRVDSALTKAATVCNSFCPTVMEGTYFQADSQATAQALRYKGGTLD